MNAKILQENKTNLMQRRELDISIDHEKAGTPKTEDVQKAVAEAAKVDEKLVTVDSISTQFGKNSTEVKAFVYKDEQAKTFAERVNKKKVLEAERKAAQEAKEKAAAEAEKPAEEAKPAEEQPAEEASNGEEAKKE